ncbi:hypothetical protein VitviT2T_002300 [Vitis vinifera]|uniref:Uncharacterized protein n=1 Tax=Vitis vinifera TaxID=29760 RepID=A0ABY9BIL0_VITVI|nr:hypothetical protein VitviT2T_002300 [Vitis vinifera]
MGRIPEWPPQDSNPSPRLKDDKVALLVPSVLLRILGRPLCRMGRIPEWPPQDSNPSPRLKDDKVALLVPSGLQHRWYQEGNLIVLKSWTWVRILGRPLWYPAHAADQGQTNK